MERVGPERASYLLLSKSKGQLKGGELCPGGREGHHYWGVSLSRQCSLDLSGPWTLGIIPFIPCPLTRSVLFSPVDSQSVCQYTYYFPLPLKSLFLLHRSQSPAGL